MANSTIEERFWRRIDKRGPDECWPWVASPHNKRFDVLRSCDNGHCCNPAHLRVGTHAENMADMVARKRAYSKRGAEHFNTKLTASQVAEIRASTGPARLIAERYSIHPSYVIGIRRGKFYPAETTNAF